MNSIFIVDDLHIILYVRYQKGVQMTEILESYQKLGAHDGKFDIVFWQLQGDEAIFQAALDRVLDSLILRGEDAIEPRLQKSVESFGKK